MWYPALVLSLKLTVACPTVLRFWVHAGLAVIESTKKNEGTLRVLPLLQEATAYIRLRPRFKPRTAAKPDSNLAGPDYGAGFLAPENWEFDPITPDFPGVGLATIWNSMR